MHALAALALLALAASTAAQAMNSTLLADLFINLGDRRADQVDCNAYANLFTADGILHSPGIPDAQGHKDIASACQESSSHVKPLTSFQELNIPVFSWNTEKRAAFRWTIGGVRTKDGEVVAADAITMVLCDPQWKIIEAWSFYDDQAIDPPTNLIGEATPPFDPSRIIRQYTMLGAPLNSQGTEFDCKNWSSLFTSTGENNEPGFPPTNGTTRLYDLCQRRTQRWSTFTASVQLALPVMSWNTDKRVAFRWTIAAVAKGESVARIIPAITTLFMTSQGKIINAWDTWDEDLFPPLD